MKVETNVVEIGEVKDNKMCAIEKVTLWMVDIIKI